MEGEGAEASGACTLASAAELAGEKPLPHPGEPIPDLMQTGSGFHRQPKRCIKRASRVCAEMG